MKKLIFAVSLSTLLWTGAGRAEEPIEIAMLDSKHDGAASVWEDLNPRDLKLRSASALVLTSAIGVLAGALLAQFINVKAMSVIAGAGFMLIGAWTLLR